MVANNTAVPLPGPILDGPERNVRRKSSSSGITLSLILPCRESSSQKASEALQRRRAAGRA